MTVSGKEAAIIGRAEVVRFLFGAPDGRAPKFEGDPSVLRAIERAFPLPTPRFGLNYV